MVTWSKVFVMSLWVAISHPYKGRFQPDSVCCCYDLWPSMHMSVMKLLDFCIQWCLGFSDSLTLAFLDSLGWLPHSLHSVMSQLRSNSANWKSHYFPVSLARSNLGNVMPEANCPNWLSIRDVKRISVCAPSSPSTVEKKNTGGTKCLTEWGRRKH